MNIWTKGLHVSVSYLWLWPCEPCITTNNSTIFTIDDMFVDSFLSPTPYGALPCKDTSEGVASDVWLASHVSCCTCCMKTCLHATCDSHSCLHCAMTAGSLLLLIGSTHNRAQLCCCVPACWYSNAVSADGRVIDCLKHKEVPSYWYSLLSPVSCLCMRIWNVDDRRVCRMC